jgi:hypothetical protein
MVALCVTLSAAETATLPKGEYRLRARRVRFLDGNWRAVQAALPFVRDTSAQPVPSLCAAWLLCRVSTASAVFPTVPPPVVEIAFVTAPRCYSARRRLHVRSFVDVASRQHSVIGVDFGHPVRVINSAGTSWRYDCLTPCFKLAVSLNRRRECAVACLVFSAVGGYVADSWDIFCEMVR